MKKLLSLILSLNLSNVAFALCPKPVITLEQGVQAPCSGFLFSREKEQEVRLQLEDYNLIKEELELKNKKINLLLEDLKISDSILEKERSKTELWRSTAEKSVITLSKLEENSHNRDFMMLFLGVVLTVGAGYAVGQAGK